VDAPYRICAICNSVVVDDHHAPERVHLKPEHMDDPRFHRDLCRRHHTERTDHGYKWFKEKYPEYEEVTLEEYRQM